MSQIFCDLLYSTDSVYTLENTESIHMFSTYEKFIKALWIRQAIYCEANGKILRILFAKKCLLQFTASFVLSKCTTHHKTFFWHINESRLQLHKKFNEFYAFENTEYFFTMQIIYPEWHESLDG